MESQNRQSVDNYKTTFVTASYTIVAASGIYFFYSFLSSMKYLQRSGEVDHHLIFLIQGEHA